MFISIRAIYVYFHSICSLVADDKRIFSPGCAVTIVSIFLVALTKKKSPLVARRFECRYRHGIILIRLISPANTLLRVIPLVANGASLNKRKLKTCSPANKYAITFVFCIRNNRRVT